MVYLESLKEVHQIVQTLVRRDPAVTIGLEFDCVRYVTVVGHGTTVLCRGGHGTLRLNISKCTV